MLYLISPKARARRLKAKELFKTVLQQSRNPHFYEIYGVPDTMEGRFEMVALHGGLLVSRLCRPDMGREGKVLAQAFFDVMFRNIDWAMRESGVGDLAVPRRIKAKMANFKGRAHAYDEAGRSGLGEMTHAISRNVFFEGPRPALDVLEQFAQYVQSAAHQLDNQGLSDFWQGKVYFPSHFPSAMGFAVGHQNNGTENVAQAA